MSHNVVAISEEQFWEQFKPIKNPHDNNASYNGCMFETFGIEHDAVIKANEANPLTVWTIQDCNGLLVIGEGYHFVNRMGYLITEVPAEPDTGYNITDEDMPKFFEGDTESVANILMPDIFDYDTPDEIPEWIWIENNASFKHVKNGENGIYEFMINTSLDFEDVPASLASYITEAKQKNIAYLMFHQGT